MKFACKKPRSYHTKQQPLFEKMAYRHAMVLISRILLAKDTRNLDYDGNFNYYYLVTKGEYIEA
jgi:hypothetical protein